MEQHNIVIEYAGKSHLFQVVVDQIRRSWATVKADDSEVFFDKDGEGKLQVVYQLGLADVGLMALVAGMIKKLLT